MTRTGGGALGIFFAALLFTGSAVPSDEFVYNSRNKRDPFVPLVTKTGEIRMETRAVEALSDVTLEGILWDPAGESLAMINGSVYKAGEKIGPYVIHQIEKDAVRLREGTNEYRLAVTEEE